MGHTGAGGHPEVLVLADGRELEYSVAGPVLGVPVVSFHGLLGGATIDADHEALCRRVGARLITVARPGYGRSTPSAGTGSVADGVGDVLELLAHLRVDACVAIGVSAGAPHALAFAALADPVHTTIVSGLPPVYLRHVRGGYGPAARAVFGLLRAPGPVGRAARRLYTRVLLTVARRLVPGDPALAETAASGGAGPQREMLLQQRPWGFELAAARNVRWLHGDADTEVPLAAVRRAAADLPGCTLEVRPGMAHFPPDAQWDEIYRAVVAAAHDDAVPDTRRRTADASAGPGDQPLAPGAGRGAPQGPEPAEAQGECGRGDASEQPVGGQRPRRADGVRDRPGDDGADRRAGDDLGRPQRRDPPAHRGRGVAEHGRVAQHVPGHPGRAVGGQPEEGQCGHRPTARPARARATRWRRCRSRPRRLDARAGSSRWSASRPGRRGRARRRAGRSRSARRRAPRRARGAGPPSRTAPPSRGRRGACRPRRRGRPRTGRRR
ncbi:hypothetical protein BJF78_04320 [Pseudonocardia sp. CNS-139]|nr:hypothetical protein BJF78_04320 [Pseudonocardia sp. CNS-139]